MSQALFPIQRVRCDTCGKPYHVSRWDLTAPPAAVDRDDGQIDYLPFCLGCLRQRLPEAKIAAVRAENYAMSLQYSAASG